MKNALLLHGTIFDPKMIGREHLNNWFPWLKKELEKLKFKVRLPELPDAIHPNLENYWNFLKDFNFNHQTLIIGHSSGAAAIFGLLQKLPQNKKIKLAISVAGFYKDEGWNCEKLFTQKFNWKKIKNQAEKILLIYSDNDPVVKDHHVNYFAEQLNIKPILITGKKHFSISSAGPTFSKFPQLLEIIRTNLKQTLPEN